TTNLPYRNKLECKWLIFNKFWRAIYFLTVLASNFFLPSVLRRHPKDGKRKLSHLVLTLLFLIGNHILLIHMSTLIFRFTLVRHPNNWLLLLLILLITSSLLISTSHQMPEPVRVKGEPSIPDILLLFLRILPLNWLSLAWNTFMLHHLSFVWRLPLFSQSLLRNPHNRIRILFHGSWDQRIISFLFHYIRLLLLNLQTHISLLVAGVIRTTTTVIAPRRVLVILISGHLHRIMRARNIRNRVGLRIWGRVPSIAVYW
ncbi:hypothetical protein TorRG33x02_295610, partial [Trema orientale]